MLKSKIIKFGVVVVILAAVGSGGYYYWQKTVAAKEASKTKPAFSTSAGIMESVKKTDIKEVVSTTGTVNIANQYNVYPEVNRKVLKVNVKVGDKVKVGDVLVAYDVKEAKDDLVKKINEAQINLENAKLSLQNLTLPVSETEILQLQSSITQAEKSIYDSQNTLKSTETKIEQAQTASDNAKKTMEDNKVLFEAGGITKDEYDKSADDYKKTLDTINDYNQTRESNLVAIDNNKKSLDDAKKKYELTMNQNAEESTQIKVQQQQNQIKLAELNIQDLKQQLAEIKDTTVSAYDGTITTVDVKEGGNVTTANSMVTISDLEHLVIQSDVSEYDAPKVVLGQKVTMTSDGLPGETYEGVVSKINEIAETKTVSGSSETTVGVEISVDNKDQKLKPGYSLDLEIVAVDKPQVLAVSISAIQTDKKENKKYVFKIDEQRNLKKTFVTAGTYGDMKVEITEGLNDGDRVVTSPTSDMQDGKPLSINRGNGTGTGKGGTQNGNGQNIRINQGVQTGGFGGGGATRSFVPNR